MRVITTHLSADFDAFAAAVCALRLYPGYRVLFPGSQELAVRRFLAETALPYPELKLREARRHKLEHVVVVDTHNPQRLGEVWQLICRDRCPVTLIDHHLDDNGDPVDGGDEECGFDADEVVERSVGATCTIVSAMMRERGLVPTAEEASLLLMGIYEDTGGLSYRDTTAEDLREAASLLDHGGSLMWVRRWVLKGLEPEQLELLNQIVEGAEEIPVHDISVSISLVEVDRYHEEAAYVVHRWVEIFRIPVGIVMLVRPPHVNLIMRSRSPGAHVGRIAETFGGGGHATAASARVSDVMPVELRERLLQRLDEVLPPAARAEDVATRKIFSVNEDHTVHATKEMTNQRRVNALPVRDAGSGELVGLVTRQILDRSVSHGMGDRPVSTVMQPGVPTVAATAPLDQVRDLFLQGSHRFVVVADSAGEPLGLITRMDLFRRLFERQSSAGSSLDHRMAGARPVRQSISRLLREVSADWVVTLLAQTRQVADTQNVAVYLVGGLVRDLLLGRANEDLDLVVEGDGIRFAEDLAELAGARCHPHPPFMTAVLILPDGHKVDVVSARTEFYRTPAALPEVATSLIRQDLYRRDFTINALAVTLNGERYGELIDFFGGRRDLHRREIRVLHSLSFIDDPTRAIRAVRYARRLGFVIAADTRNLMATAVEEHVFDRVSGQRLRRELEQLLVEDHPTPALLMLAELGLLAAVLPGVVWTERSRSFLIEVEGQLAWYRLEELGQVPPAWLLYLGALVVDDGEEVSINLARRLQLSGELQERMARLPQRVEELRRCAVSELRRSQRMREAERHPAEVVVLAMAGLSLGDRRRLADAVTAAARIRCDLSGGQLLEAGIPPGSHIGHALASARDALVDGEIAAGEVLDFAVAAARAELTGKEAES